MEFSVAGGWRAVGLLLLPLGWIPFLYTALTDMSRLLLARRDVPASVNRALSWSVSPIRSLLVNAVDGPARQGSRMRLRLPISERATGVMELE